jgi:hypothetical protein
MPAADGRRARADAQIGRLRRESRSTQTTHQIQGSQRSRNPSRPWQCRAKRSALRPWRRLVAGREPCACCFPSRWAEHRCPAGFLRACSQDYYFERSRHLLYPTVHPGCERLITCTIPLIAYRDVHYCNAQSILVHCGRSCMLSASSRQVSDGRFMGDKVWGASSAGRTANT